MTSLVQAGFPAIATVTDMLPFSNPLESSDAVFRSNGAASITRSNEQYAALATHYDALTPRLEPLRREAHAMLQLRAGETVMDVGCGTGKSLLSLSRAVGPNGQVIAIEPCGPMMAQAQARHHEQPLNNVRFVSAQIEAVLEHVPAQSVDAFLLMFTHDVLQSESAIAALLRVARPGAQFALAGGKFFSGPLALLNPWVKWRQQPYCTTFENYDAPWRRLFANEGIIEANWRLRYGGIAFVASAKWRGPVKQCERDAMRSDRCNETVFTATA
jgi:SAM-dependent methyltransferase